MRPSKPSITLMVEINADHSVIASLGCRVSINPQHHVDNLRCNPLKVTGTLLRSRPESNQWASEDSEHCPFETDRLHDMENTRRWKVAV